MHQLLLTGHWRRVQSSPLAFKTIRLRLGVVCAATVLMVMESSTEGQFTEMKFWVLSLQKMLWWLCISNCFYSSIPSTKKPHFLYC